MLSLFRNTRILGQVMVPLAMLAVVAIGAGGFVSRALVETDAKYNRAHSAGTAGPRSMPPG